MTAAIGIPRQPNRPPVLALVAHDEKKDDLVRLARDHRGTLSRVRLVATSHTGSQLAQELGIDVECVRSGPEGGDMQIGARIVEGGVDAVVFLRDPLTAHPHEPDIQALMKVCDVHGVPLATNLASAEILLLAVARITSAGLDDRSIEA